jgi:hypothetical protein
MQNPATRANRNYLIFVAILAWAGLLIQLYLTLTSRKLPLAETIVRFFSYFTILTNLLVALYAAFRLLKPYSRLSTFFSTPSASTALTLHICVVGIVYNTVLRNLWSPEGLSVVADELTHLIVPLAFLIYWLLFVPKGGLKLKDSFSWLIYPALYFVWVIIFGSLSGFYPYFFVNVSELGYSKVFANSGMLLVGFFLLAVLFIGIDRLMKRERSAF